MATRSSSRYGRSRVTATSPAVTCAASNSGCRSRRLADLAAAHVLNFARHSHRWSKSDEAVDNLVLAVAGVSAQEATRPTVVGRIIGHLDGVSRDGDHYLLSGWACQQGQVKSINVQLFLAQSASNPSQLAPVLTETANLDNEPAVNAACQDRGGGKHRFLIVLPYGYAPDSPLAVHGLRIVDGVPNDAVAGS